VSECKIALIGATGAVGQVFLRILEERNFPASDIRLCASERSFGKKIKVRGEKLIVEEATPQLLSEVDFVFISGGRSLYRRAGAEQVGGLTQFVLTRDEGFRCDDCTVVHDVVDALIYTGMIGGEVFVAGGAEVYEQFLPLAERLYITRIDADFGGDTRFPTVFWEDWREISREKGPRDERNLYDHWYIVYERKGAFGAKARGAKGKGRPGQRRPAKSGRPGTGARRNR